jgi:hypothetical protein
MRGRHLDFRDRKRDPQLNTRLAFTTFFAKLSSVPAVETVTAAFCLNTFLTAYAG